MKITEILQAYHSMPACDRLDLLCRMLRHCIPYEMRFLGTVLLDGARSHYKSYIGKVETSANRVNYYSTMKEGGLTHEVCEKLCCALAVLHADNRPVGEIIFNMLNDSRVMAHFEEANDLKVMQDFRLLYIMAVNHPALSFNQRQHLMYTFLQRMDSLFTEKCKYSFSGSFSNSIEKTLTSEGESGKYPPEGHFGEVSADAYIVRCEVHSVYKRTTDKRYAYMIQVEWSDGVCYTVRRTYGDFFSFQTKLLDLFPEEGGQKGKKHPRLIPYLPGKNYSKFLKNRDVAEKRLPELHRYSRDLIALPDHVTRSPHVLEFFKPKPTDMKEDYPAFHKITTLYDLMESGKIRSRVSSEPMKSSPSHSPSLHHHGSPLQRAMHNSSSGVSSPLEPGAAPSTPRSSHTLPPVPSTSTQQVTEELTPVIPRRPTYPLSRQLQKSEGSAFTPVHRTALSGDDLASSATLTASIISIPGSASTAQTTPILHQTTPTTSTTTPTNSSSVNSFVFSNPNPVNETSSNSIPMSPDSIPVSNSAAGHSQHRSLCSSQAVVSNGRVVYHSCTPICSGEDHLIISTSGITLASSSPYLADSGGGTMTHPQMDTTSPNKVMSTSGGDGVTPPQSSFSPTQHLTSPTSAMSSPLLAATLSPSLVPPMSPSPPHSGTNTPRGVAYPQQVILYPPYSPAYSPAYFYSSTPSPLDSPKTSNKWHGSYSSVNHGLMEYENLFKWLKSLRLHKYHSVFENLTFEEMCQMTMEDMERKGMTTGAAKKLCKKLDELKMSNFIGFRDMPFSGSMARKPSTCSLPAALQMEVGMTPSSSYDTFSPTGSTCSLDKYGHTSSIPQGAGYSLLPNHTKQHSSHDLGNQSCQNEPNVSNGSPICVGSIDAAILKAIPSSSSTGKPPDSCMPSLGSGDVKGMSDSSRTTHISSKGSTKSSASNSPAAVAGTHPSKCPPRSSGTTGTNSSSSSSSQQTSNNRSKLTANSASPSLSNLSWADQGEEPGTVNQPNWAQMSSSTNGESHSDSETGNKTTPTHSNPNSTNAAPVYNAASDRGGGGTCYHHHQHQSHVIRSSPSAPHTPIHGYHAHHLKRNSHEGAGGGGSGHELITDATNIVIPQPLHPAVRNQVGGANSNWNTPLRQCFPPSATPTIIRGQPQSQRHISHTHHHHHHNQISPNTNGLMGTPTLSQTRFQGVAYHHHHHQHPGGVASVAYPQGNVGHPPPPVMCYNCGKRGHLGNTCPGVTMDADDPTSFHRQLVNGSERTH